MKTIKLKKLVLKDWRAQNKVVEFSDNTEIRGYNSSGKSNVYNAFLWLLTGCDAEDRSNYNLFDNTIEQTHETSKIASVEGVFEINSVEYTLKRTAEMGWTRKRGSEIYERKGADSYSFYVDHIERNAGEYKKTIEELFAPMDKLKIMLNLQYFLRLEWKEMRKNLEAMVEEIGIDDLKGDYSIIKNELAKYTPEQIKESIKGQMKPIKQSINGLPITIETLKSNLPDISGLDEVQKEIEEAKSQIADIDKQLLGSSSNIQPFIDKRNAELAKISELENDYINQDNEHNKQFRNKVSEIKTQISAINIENEHIKKINERKNKDFGEIKEILAMTKETLSKLQEYRLELLKRNEEVKAMQFTEDTCTYCGQMLPEDKLEEAKARFNSYKDSRHKAIVAEGKANNQHIERNKEEIAKLESILEKGVEEKPLKDKSELENKLRELEANFVSYDQTIEGKEKMAEISHLKANLTVIPSSNTDGLVNMKRSLMEDVEELSKKMGLKDEYEKQKGIIADKQAELKESAVELARLEGMLNKVVQFEREKAQIISDRVNEKFDYVQIQMTEVNKSGELVDTCKVLDDKGVSASVTNFASQVRCGIDISTAFCKFYGVNLPCFVDFAESVCEDNYPDTERQTVKLIVDNCKFNVVNK